MRTRDSKDITIWLQEKEQRTQLNSRDEYLIKWPARMKLNRHRDKGREGLNRA